MIYLNGQPLNVTVFPDKTSQVWKLPESTFKSNKAHVLWRFENEAEVMHIAQLQTLLKTSRIDTTLELTYLPYARQDKAVSNETTFALEVFMGMLRNLQFDFLIVHDPHNWDAVRPGCAAEAIYPVKKVEEVAQEMDKNGSFTIFCYPDKGALTKYSKVYLTSFRPHIYGEKVRDQLTGNIISYKVIGDCGGLNVLIVDDICDGGATFKLLAKDLLAAGAKEVSLFVTHGIFSRGVKTLHESGIKRVFTRDGEKSET